MSATNGWDPDADLAELIERQRRVGQAAATAELLEIDRRAIYGEGDDHWLAGEPMDPAAGEAEPLPPLAGFPFLHAGCSALISGPTGGGRSALMQACLYDAAKLGLRGAYLGSEVTLPEFAARARLLAELRGEPMTYGLRRELASIRYLNLASVLTAAWDKPDEWAAEVAERFDVVVLDPLSSVASALDLDFDRSNMDFVRFYDRLVEPLRLRSVAVLLVDNIGHDATGRAKGVSAKPDRADFVFSCRKARNPIGLTLVTTKVRTIRTTIKIGDQWLFARDSQLITQVEREPQRELTVITGSLMVKICDYIESNPRCSANEIYKGVGGKREKASQHLEYLVEAGNVKRETETGTTIQGRSFHTLVERWSDK